MTEHDSDAIALITEDMRRAVIKVGLDPMGATATELGIAKAITILAAAIHAGTVADYRGS
jgi:hypothetical protein